MARRWAVLIDAENVSAEVADPLFARVATWRDACVRRMYGDFEGRQALWKAKRPVHHIETVQLSDMVQGKNGADIALVIDAVDLMGRGHLDGFCLVTSDSDFTRLAWRLRAEGRTVRGVGRASAAEAFRAACSEFFVVESLIGGTDAVVSKSPASGVSGKPSPRKAITTLEKAVASLPNAGEWHNLAEVGGALKKLNPEFSYKSYEGCTSLLKLVRGCGAFRVRKSPKDAYEIAGRV